MDDKTLATIATAVADIERLIRLQDVIATTAGIVAVVLVIVLGAVLVAQDIENV